jgi:hypothetical protein
MGNRYKLTRKIRIEKLISEAISRINKDLQLNEDASGVNVKIDDLQKINPDQIAKIANKANINVVDEADEPETLAPAIEARPNLSVPVKKTIAEKSAQEQAVYNLKAWAMQLNKKLSDGQSIANKALKFTYPEGDDLVTILILQNGLIKASGHVIKDFKDFKRLAAFHKEV